jgi:hypothetical protein
MVSKHCLTCGTKGHPQQRHPSTLRTEATVWLVAIAIGGAAGLWSAINSPSSEPLSRSVQSMALSVVHPADAPPAENDVAAAPAGGTGTQLLGWLVGIVIAFVKIAWWVLPIPILFSLWRQTRSHAICRACGSRALEELITPHGALPPAI